MARHHVGTYRYWGSIHDKSIAQTVLSCVFLFIFMCANKKKYFSEYHLKNKGQKCPIPFQLGAKVMRGQKYLFSTNLSFGRYLLQNNQ